MTTTNKNFELLSVAWNTRCSKIAEGSKLYDRGNKLLAEGRKLCAEGGKLWNEGNKLVSQGNKLCVKGSKLCDEGRFLWDSTVSRVLGPLNSMQIWLCDNTICLLTDGSLWKVPA